MSRDRGSLPERLASQFAADFLLCHYESGQPERARTSVSYLPKGCTCVHQLHIWLPKQLSLASPGRSLPCAAPLAEVMEHSLYLEREYEQLWGHFSSKSLSEELQKHFCQESALGPHRVLGTCHSLEGGGLEEKGHQPGPPLQSKKPGTAFLASPRTQYMSRGPVPLSPFCKMGIIKPVSDELGIRPF